MESLAVDRATGGSVAEDLEEGAAAAGIGGARGVGRGVATVDGRTGVTRHEDGGVESRRGHGEGALMGGAGLAERGGRVRAGQARDHVRQVRRRADTIRVAREQGRRQRARDHGDAVRPVPMVSGGEGLVREQQREGGDAQRQTATRPLCPDDTDGGDGTAHPPVPAQRRAR